MSGRALILTVCGIIFSTSIILYNIGSSSSKITQNVNSYYLRQTGKNLAQSGVNLAVSQLGNNLRWRTGFTNLSMLGGTINVSVSDTIFVIGNPPVRDSVIKIKSIGTLGTNSGFQRNDTSMAYILKRLRPPGVKSVVTTNGTTKVAGGYSLDGRDHDSTGKIIANSGVWGIWSTSSFTQGGSSTIGGTSGTNGKDYSPAKDPIDTPVVRMNQPYSGGYPTTPDSVLGGATYGFPEGTLKAIAQSGVGGSQYVTDPTLLKYPLSGVTYVELPSGVSWGTNKTQSLLSGSGIVVCHNSSGNATITNGSGKSSFSGLLIADDASALAGILYGAIVCLSSNPPSGNPHIGTGNGSILYSNWAINRALDFVSSPVRGDILAWWE